MLLNRQNFQVGACLLYTATYQQTLRLNLYLLFLHLLQKRTLLLLLHHLSQQIQGLFHFQNQQRRHPRRRCSRLY
jgi:hypothetical protein